MNRQILKILVIQYSLGGGYLLVIAAFEAQAVMSALAGCLACLVPYTYQSIKMLRQSKNDNAVEWLGYVYRSEFVKWLMTGMIFVLIFTSNVTWDPVVLFAGYCLLQVSSGIITFLIKGN